MNLAGSKFNGSDAEYFGTLAVVGGIVLVVLARKGDVATLTLGVVQWPETSPGNRDAVVAAMAAEYRTRHPRSAVQPVRLPIGPALVAFSGGEFHLPEHDVRTQIKAEYQIPLPDGRYVVILSVVAESEDAWPAVAEATAKVAWSLRSEQENG
nr:hypothetical protein [Amycolatopsis lexingtonensis]